jgi:hypothetical protein
MNEDLKNPLYLYTPISPDTFMTCHLKIGNKFGILKCFLYLLGETMFFYYEKNLNNCKSTYDTPLPIPDASVVKKLADKQEHKFRDLIVKIAL